MTFLQMQVPELDETFSVVINSSNAGTLGAAVTSVFTILANDDPYGVFVFSSGSSTVRTPERNESVTLQVSGRLIESIFH